MDFCQICEGLGRVPYNDTTLSCGHCRGTGLANPPETEHPGQGEEYVEQRESVGSVPGTGPTINFQGREVAGPKGGGSVNMQYDEEGNPTNMGIPFGGIFTRSADPLDAAWSVLKGFFSELDIVLREQGREAALAYLAEKGITGPTAENMLRPDIQ